MTWGPFNTKEGGEIIAKFTNDELLPATKGMRDLAIDISSYKIALRDYLWKDDLNKLENTYKDMVVKFMKLYNKFSTPDILFQDIVNKDEPLFIADYFQSQGAVMWHFNEGFRLLSYMNSILVQQNTAIYNRRIFALSLFAIVISIVSIFAAVYSK